MRTAKQIAWHSPGIYIGHSPPEIGAAIMPCLYRTELEIRCPDYSNQLYGPISSA
jgi:hypothetical protein